MDRIHTVCLIGSKVIKDEEIKRVVKSRGWTLLTFESATEALGSPNNNTNSGIIYVLDDFEGPDFQALHKSDRSVNRNERKNIFGPGIMRDHLGEIERMVEEKCPRSGNSRSGNLQGVIASTIGKFYNLKLRGKRICISGVRCKEDTPEWNRLVGLIRFMGGEDVKKVEIGTDYLISRTRKAEGEKYRKAVDYDIPVLTCDWLDHSWAQRDNPDFLPTAPELLARYRIKPFEGLRLAFVNYNDKDLKEMVTMTQTNGGEVVEPLDHSCTHIIVDSVPGDKNSIQFDFDSLRNKLSPTTIHQYILYQEWFWSSIELGGCIDEKRSDLVYPVQGTRNNPGPKASSLSEFRGGRSSIQSPGIDMSFSSFLSPNISTTTYSRVDSPVKCTPVKFDPKTATKRHINCMELYSTEGNYVEILRKMVHEIQKPLEEKKYLDAAEMKIIFGNLPALLECHENIYNDLDFLIGKNWDENNKIGDVFVKHGHSMFRSYTNFVNSFEFSKEMIAKCEEKCQQFRAFLMIARNKCDRQSLQDLFIAPVQRIPRYLLLLKDIQKNTDPSNPDSGCIKAGISRVEQVLTQINENKRKTEGHVMMLDVVNEIEGGAHLLSSKRHFVDKIDVKLLLNENGSPSPWKGHPLTLLLFDDVLEICKKRSIKKSDSVTSRNSAKSSSYKSTGKKPYKHIEMVKLSDIESVYEIDDEDEYDKMVFIRTKDMAGDRKSFKSFPIQLRTPDNSFLSKLKCYFMNEKENDFKEDTFKTVPLSVVSSIDFTYAEYLASTISKSSFGKARAKLSRTFSMSRRQSVSTTNLSVPGSNGDHEPQQRNRESLLTLGTCHSNIISSNHHPGLNLPKAPSTTPRRSSSRFMTNFVSPLTNSLTQSISSLGTPLSHLNRQISISSLAINKLNEKEEHDADAFSLPSTPAPRKKKCTPAPPQVFITPAYNYQSPSK